PASVTKLMTLFLVLEDVHAGKYALDARAVATPDVNRCEASWVGIRPGESMTVRDLCLALMVESANDAAIVLAVHSAGSLDAFVARMNARAAELGMTRTRYYNPNGLPPNAKRRYPWKSFNVSTANDQLRLALALLKLPETLEFTSVKTCDLVKTAGGYRTSVTRRVNTPLRRTVLAPDEKIVMALRNHNNVMVKDKQKIFNPDGTEAVDGLKTGYIDAGGSSVVITGSRGGRRAVAVVLGSSSAAERDEHAARLVSDALGVLAW
ncbi:MAG: D-alanyl-D-alanine carboxypeptidase, partial [Kiritimatiellae bacterium]|nr:D-alanyl-D-alanine carboxypeptidase [Kiritimatiellia bacterium]